MARIQLRRSVHFFYVVSACHHVVRALLPGVVGVQRAAHVCRRTRRCGAARTWHEVLRCRRICPLFGLCRQRAHECQGGRPSADDEWHCGGISGAKRQDTVRMDSDSRTLLCSPHAVVGHPDGTPSDKAYSGMAVSGNESVARCATTATAEAAAPLAAEFES